MHTYVVHNPLPTMQVCNPHGCINPPGTLHSPHSLCLQLLTCTYETLKSTYFCTPYISRLCTSCILCAFTQHKVHKPPIHTVHVCNLLRVRKCTLPYLTHTYKFDLYICTPTQGAQLHTCKGAHLCTVYLHATC